MSEAPLRVAVIGTGHLGRIHAKIWSEHPEAELVCVLDTDAERAQAVASEFGCRAATDLSSLPGEVDAVSVVVSTPAHAAVAAPLLEAGVPCLVEKPIASNLSDADRILQAANKSGALVAVGHVERFQPALLRVREMGLRPRFIECHRLTAFSFRSTEVGVVHDLMIHDLDLVLDLIGAPLVSVDAVGTRIFTDREDVASVRLAFEGGARANVTANRVSLSPMRRFRMFSSDAYASLDFVKNYGLIVRKGPRWDAERGSLVGLDPEALAKAQSDMLESGLLEVEELKLEGEQRPLQAELDAFLRNVRSGTTPEVSGVQGRRALELAEQIVEQIERQPE